MPASDTREYRERSTSPMDVDGLEEPAPVIPPPLPDQDVRHPPADPHCPPRPPSERPADQIFFYQREQPLYEFTNFAPCGIDWDGYWYPTAEHLFQAHKFMTTRPDLVRRIRNLPSARAALEEAGRLRRLQRSDWFDVNVGIMEAILEAKFTQHPELRRMLLSTGDGELIENSPVDSFWGCGEDGEGRNELGKALMRLRNKLRSTELQNER
ncbi:hypothetical protein EVJ58_g5434 [Rhodofomes roseus]|uniref:NADAR domain-containing protein n=1 Tax=Rhodofomes roseus TaxID=34475 RepID=A0A4Y9YDL8_9APHY|nr:hypothetical protein EVJ58_g5434 [Rhodofomes roseus]